MDERLLSLPPPIVFLCLRGFDTRQNTGRRSSNGGPRCVPGWLRPRSPGRRPKRRPGRPVEGSGGVAGTRIRRAESPRRRKRPRRAASRGAAKSTEPQFYSTLPCSASNRAGRRAPLRPGFATRNIGPESLATSRSGATRAESRHFAVRRDGSESPAGEPLSTTRLVSIAKFLSPADQPPRPGPY